jgi:magnesium transporter
VRVLTAIEPAEIEQLRARDEFFWLDLQAPSPEDIKRLGELFDLHPLAIEDSIKFDQRPKLEDYGNFVFIVFYGARQGEHETKLLEVHLFVSGSFVITVRHDRCDELSMLCERMPRDEHASEQFVVYRILDTMTDTFFPVLAAIDEEIDELSEAITTEPDDRQLHRILRLKRSLVSVRRVVNPERDLLARGMDQIVQVPGLKAETRNYFRDVYDHLIRISEMIDSYRDLLTGTMDVYLSVTSNRLNQVIKQLTVVATVFLPLTFVTGFFGQNFGWMVHHVDTLEAFLAFGVGASLLTVIGLVLWFWRSGYIGADASAGPDG